MINFISEQLQQFAKKQGDKPDFNLVIPLTSFNLLPFLKGQALLSNPVYPAIYWQDREQQQSIACLGQIEECDYIPQATEQACYFGGLAFQQQGEQWQDFPAIRFIRPALEFNLSCGKMTLTCHFNGRQRLSDTLSLVQRLQPPQPLSAVKNRVLSRSDLPDRQQWAKLVEQAIEYKALLPKVVLSRQSELLCQSRINHLDLLGQWQKATPNSFHFSLQFSEKHAYIGSSPERLFRRDKRHLKTEALAGTINRGRNKLEDNFLQRSLLTDKKIDRENYLVREFIVSNLQLLKAQVSCGNAYIMQLHNVQHLCVPITATLNSATSDAELLSRLHPTPAVGGFPKQAALQFIDKQEPYLRGWYAGTVGYLRKEKSDFSVAIRSALIAENSVKLFAGAGIVNGSVAAQEWQELDNKIQTILDIITRER